MVHRDEREGELMIPARIGLALALTVAIVCGTPAGLIAGGQVWTKCEITCRCHQDDSVGNYSFVLPIDATPDTGFDADWACKVHGNRVCADSCNGTKFSYTYQVTSP